MVVFSQFHVIFFFRFDHRILNYSHKMNKIFAKRNVHEKKITRKWISELFEKWMNAVEKLLKFYGYQKIEMDFGINFGIFHKI